MKQISNDTFFHLVEEEISNGRQVHFRVKGISMFPLLRDGKDIVVLEKCDPSLLGPMDVVLFKYNGRHLLHRIIRRDGNRLYIRGDGSYIAKEECTTEDVIGKVQTVIRPGGKNLSVNSWRWRLPSSLWQHTGIFRNLLLRIAHLFAT